MAGRRAGRPSKLTPAVCQKIIDAIRAGNFLQTAAEYAGVDRSTVHDWMRRGEAAHDGPFKEFAAEVRGALAAAEVRDLALIGKAAMEGHWQAAAWRLERKFPERYGRRDASWQLYEQRTTAEIDTLKAKLKILEAGDDPDDRRITLVVERDYTEKPDSGTKT